MKKKQIEKIRLIIYGAIGITFVAMGLTMILSSLPHERPATSQVERAYIDKDGNIWCECSCR